MNEKQAIVKEFYHIEDLAHDLKISVQTLKAVIKSGELKASKKGRQYIITRDAVIEWLNK